MNKNTEEIVINVINNGELLSKKELDNIAKEISRQIQEALKKEK